MCLQLGCEAFVCVCVCVCVVKQVLEQVYINQQNVDEELVDSILWPSQHPNAAESFYQIISGKGTPVNLLLKQLDKVQIPLKPPSF